MRRVLFALLAVSLGTGCICNGCMCPSSNGYPDWEKYRAAELADRELKAQPVVDALEKHKASRGDYPNNLPELVSRGFLDAVPDLASNVDHQGKSGRVEKAGALSYEPTGGEYRLRMTFSFVEQAWTTTKLYTREYNSRDRRWTHASTSPSPPASLPTPAATKP